MVSMINRAQAGWFDSKIGDRLPTEPVKKLSQRTVVFKIEGRRLRLADKIRPLIGDFGKSHDHTARVDLSHLLNVYKSAKLQDPDTIADLFDLGQNVGREKHRLASDFGLAKLP